MQANMVLEKKCDFSEPRFDMRTRCPSAIQADTLTLCLPLSTYSFEGNHYYWHSYKEKKHSKSEGA